MDNVHTDGQQRRRVMALSENPDSGGTDARFGGLAGVPLFAGLPRADLFRCERRCRWQRYRGGDLIIDAEDRSRDVYIVVAGAVRVVNYGPSGREISLADLRAGDLFGELAAIDGKPRSARVVAVADSELATMPGAAFLEIAREHPSVSLALLRRFAAVVRAANERIMDLSTQGAHNRVCAELLRLAREGLAREGVPRIAPVPPQAEIASRVSTTRETVSRVFSELEGAGLICRGRGAITVSDIESLARLVERFHHPTDHRS